MTTHLNKAIFFDRDGVLNEDIGYLHRTEDFRWIDGAPEAIAAARAKGFRVIVVTNQSGIARGYYTPDDMARLHAYIDANLESRGIGAMDAWYHCPYHPDAVVSRWQADNHPNRKPNPGMILAGLKDFDLTPSHCLIIGDQDSDVEAGRRAGIAAMKFRGGRLDMALAPALLSLSSPL